MYKAKDIKTNHRRKRLTKAALPASHINCCASCCGFQGVMEETAVLSGDNSFNAHFGECIAAIGDIDDDGFQGRSSRFPTPTFMRAISR